MHTKILVLVLFLIAFVTVNAQSPTPIIVQSASVPAVTSAASKVTGSVDTQSIPAAIILLEQIKAGNDEVLAKQKAALEKLDELRDAADQLRIFAKRG